MAERKVDLNTVVKVIDFTKPFKNGCGYRNGKLEDVEEFMKCAVTLASVVNPQIAVAKYGMVFLNFAKEIQSLEEVVEDVKRD